jgi:hypothetical protein
LDAAHSPLDVRANAALCGQVEPFAPLIDALGIGGGRPTLPESICALKGILPARAASQGWLT